MAIHRLLHALYGFDITLCAFWLFRYVKMKLEAMFFDRPAAILAEIEGIVGDMSTAEWVKVFDEWKDRLKRFIDREGEYL
jgi:hypothetical protein